MASGNGPVLCIVGARPNYMKMAPLLRAIKSRAEMPSAVLVHTGQHYDFDLNDRLFVDLGLPAPDVNLEVGSGSHAIQTAEVMKRFEPVIDDYGPSCVVVVGDVNSTLACTLVASKKHVPVAHVEAGLRSFDRSMPEEINRVLTDQIAALLYTTERSAHTNLAREGIAGDRVHFVGNLMIDSLLSALPKAVSAVDLFRREAWMPRGPARSPVRGDYAAPSVECRRCGDFVECGRDTVRGGTAQACDLAGSSTHTGQHREVRPPQQVEWSAYRLSAGAGLSRNSGPDARRGTGADRLGRGAGRSTALGTPRLTMRPNTERPITVDEGTNTLVGAVTGRILAAVDDVFRTGGKRGRILEFWDGKPVPRIADHIAQWLVSLNGVSATQ